MKISDEFQEKKINKLLNLQISFQNCQYHPFWKAENFQTILLKEIPTLNEIKTSEIAGFEHFLLQNGKDLRQMTKNIVIDQYLIFTALLTL